MVTWVLVVGVLGIGLAQPALAERYESPNYTIDASVGNSFGGDSSSGSYKLTSSGGESIIGNGQGGSYTLGQGYVAQLERSLQMTVQPSGLEAYYDFEEKSGQISYDGSINNNTLNEEYGSFARMTGKVGTALSSDGADDTRADHSSSLSQTTAFTVSSWIKISSVGTAVANPTFLRKGSGTTTNYVFGVLDTTGEFRAASSFDGTIEFVKSGIDVTDNAWHHVAYSVAGGDQKIYVDGQLKNERAIVGTVDSNVDPLRLNTPTDVEMSYDEVKLYSRTLSDDEIEAEYDAGEAGDAAGLSFPGEIISGTSQTIEADAVVQTDAPGYAISLSQNTNLTSSTSTIPAITSASISSPVAWNEGTTKGLGFTLTSSNATAIDAKWNSGAAYAPLPSAATSIYSRSGYTSGIKDVTSLKYRLDVTPTQPSGKYTNTVTYTGTMTP